MNLRIALLVVSTLLTGGCASSGIYQMSDAWCATHPEASPARCVRDHTLSMDQENLKRFDVGCPTAVFITPGGKLEQCAP